MSVCEQVISRVSSGAKIPDFPLKINGLSKKEFLFDIKLYETTTMILALTLQETLVVANF